MVNDVLFFVGIVKGDRARYPFKLRGKPLITIPIVVAVLRKTKTQSKPKTEFFRNCLSCDGRLGHLCQNISYGKEQHPQGNHLYQRQGGGGLD